MAQGKSGRIVLEVDPVLKDRIYSVLRSRGQTLKEWFLAQAAAEVEASQLKLDFSGAKDAPLGGGANGP
jgi:hypothetical protein